MEFKDYYQTLGVSHTATADEIKKAYRKLARKYHPDVSKEPDAVARMTAVNEANAVLSDPEKRAAYDRLAQEPRMQPGQDFRPPPHWDAGFEFSDGTGGPGGAPGDCSDFFEQLFGRADRARRAAMSTSRWWWPPGRQPWAPRSRWARRAARSSRWRCPQAGRRGASCASKAGASRAHHRATSIWNCTWPCHRPPPMPNALRTPRWPRPFPTTTRALRKEPSHERPLPHAPRRTARRWQRRPHAGRPGPRLPHGCRLGGRAD